MPPFASLSATDLNALMAFLQSPRPPLPVPAGAGRAGPPPYPATASAPPRQFAAYSAMPAFITPPYSTITAYDLNTGEIKWQVPNGEAIGVDPPGNNFGIMKDHGPKAKLAVTAGGLAFQATVEKKIRAYDKDTGKVLWTHPLPDGSEGSPAIYEVDGRQYSRRLCPRIVCRVRAAAGCAVARRGISLCAGGNAGRYAHEDRTTRISDELALSRPPASRDYGGRPPTRSDRQNSLEFRS